MNRCIATTRRSNFDAELFRTECTVYEDDPVFIAHLGALVFGKALQNILVMFDRAPASTTDGGPGLNENLIFFVEQPPGDRFKRKFGIEQFFVP